MDVKDQYKCQVSSKQSSFVDCMFVLFSQGFHVKFIEDMNTIKDPMNVLELGCYNARLMNHLIQRKVRVTYTGIDVRQEYLDDSELKDHEDVTLLCEDVTKGLSVASNTQDIVVCSEVFEHLDADDLAPSVKELCRVLKNGGKLVTSFPMNTREKVFHEVDNEKDLGHVNFPVHEDYIDLLTSCGMSLSEFYSGFSIRSSYKPRDSIRNSYEYNYFYRNFGQRMAIAYAMTVDTFHTGGGYYIHYKV